MFSRGTSLGITAKKFRKKKGNGIGSGGGKMWTKPLKGERGVAK